MGAYAWCKNCKDVTRWVFFDGAYEHNPLWICGSCENEQQEIDEDTEEIEELKEHKGDMTTSDLQGCVMALSKKYNIPEEDIIEYIHKEE